MLKSQIEDNIGGVHIRETFYVLYPGFLYDYPEYSEKTTDLSQVTDKLTLSHNIISLETESNSQR